MPSKKPTRRRSSRTATTTNDLQPPHRGHGSSHAKRGSQQPQPPLRTKPIAENLRLRLKKNGGPTNLHERMAQEILAQDDAKERSLRQALRRKREQDDQRRHDLQQPGLSDADRSAMAELTQALLSCTAALREFLDHDSTEDDELVEIEESEFQESERLLREVEKGADADVGNASDDDDDDDSEANVG